MELFLIVKIIVEIYFKMNELKYKITNSLKKSDCIEILKDTLTFEELKNLITPNFQQLIHILKCLTKREVQYICFKHEKITIAKITDIIKNKSMNEKNTIDKTFFEDEDAEEEEEIALPIEKIEVKKIPAENPQSKKLNEKITLQHNPTQNNWGETPQHPPPTASGIAIKKVRVEEPITELNEVNINIEELPSSETINLKTGGNPPDYKRNCETNMEKLDKIYNVKKVKEVLFNNGLNDEQITNYFKLNTTKIVEKMKNHKDYGKHFINLTANDYKEVYELMRML